MNQIFKSFNTNGTIRDIEAEVIAFVNDNQINPLSLGLTNKPEGGFLAVLGYDKSKFTSIEFKVARSGGVETDAELFEAHLNQDEKNTELETGETIICHALTFDDEEVLNIVMMLEAK